MADFEEASLQTIGNGEAIDQFNFQLKRAIENCQDVNTDAETVRMVTLKVRIKPDKERKEASIDFQAEARLAPDSKGKDQMYFGRAGAYVSPRRQLSFDEYQQEQTANVVEMEEEGTND